MLVENSVITYIVCKIQNTRVLRGGGENGNIGVDENLNE